MDDDQDGDESVESAFAGGELLLSDRVSQGTDRFVHLVELVHVPDVSAVVLVGTHTDPSPEAFGARLSKTVISRRWWSQTLSSPRPGWMTEPAAGSAQSISSQRSRRWVVVAVLSVAVNSDLLTGKAARSRSRPVSNRQPYWAGLRRSG